MERVCCRWLCGVCVLVLCCCEKRELNLEWLCNWWIFGVCVCVCMSWYCVVVSRGN